MQSEGATETIRSKRSGAGRSTILDFFAGVAQDLAEGVGVGETWA